MMSAPRRPPPARPASRPTASGVPGSPTLRPTRETRRKSFWEGPGAWILRVVVFGAVGIAAFVIVPPWWSAWQAKPKWDDAVSAYEAGEFKKAIGLFQEAKKLAPDWEEIGNKFPEELVKCYLGMAQNAEEASDWKGAAEAWMMMIREVPDRALREDAYYKAARFLRFDPARAEEAKAYAQRAIEKAGGKHEMAKTLLKGMEK